MTHLPGRFMIVVSSFALEVLISWLGGRPKAPSFDPSGVVGTVCMPATVACPSTSNAASGSELSLFCAQPNKRLKLAAPSSCGSLPFVNSSSRRRSLGASR